MKKILISTIIIVAGYFVAKRIVKKALNFDDLFIDWDCT